MPRKLELIIEDHSTIVYVDIEDNPRLSDTIPLSTTIDNQFTRVEDGYYVPPTSWEDLRDKPASTAEEIDDAVSRSEQNASSIEGLEQSKVDKVVGKQLSTEDFTSAEKSKLAELENFDYSAIQAQLSNKVDKVVGKELSTNDFTDQLRDKLASLEGSHFRGTFPSKAALEAAIPTAVAGDYADVDEAGQDVERHIWDSSDSIWVISTSKATPLTAAQIKQLYESNPDTNPFDDGAEAKLEGIADGATANSEDAYLLNRANHTGTQEISTVVGLVASLGSKADQTSLDAVTSSKVDKVEGKGLSTNDLTDPLYDKLVGLEGTHWRGTFVSLAALVAGVTDPQAGDYADVDVVGEDVQRYIWDATDSEWVVQIGAAAPITAAQVKQLYESNPDTNPFDDAADAKLEGIAAGATVNQTDAYLLNRGNHTGTQPINTVAGLTAELSGKVGTTDPRLSDPRTPTGAAGGVLSGTYPDPTFAVDMATQAGLDAVAAAKVDKVAGKELSTNDYTTTEKNKLSGIATGATANQTDTYLLSRANHTGVQAISTITGLQDELSSINNLIGEISTTLDAINGEVV